jgi:hypothetical protein
MPPVLDLTGVTLPYFVKNANKKAEHIYSCSGLLIHPLMHVGQGLFNETNLILSRHALESNMLADED